MLSSRASRFFGEVSPGKTFGDVATEIQNQIRRSIARSSDVVLASYSIGCDGKPVVSLLDGSPCDTDGDGIVMATRDRGVLSGFLPAPLRSNNPGTGGVTRVTIQVGTEPLSRYFLDGAGVIYEGRSLTYHAGHSPRAVTNGTQFTDTDTTTVTAGMIAADRSVDLLNGAF